MATEIGEVIGAWKHLSKGVEHSEYLIDMAARRLDNGNTMSAMDFITAAQTELTYAVEHIKTLETAISEIRDFLKIQP